MGVRWLTWLSASWLVVMLLTSPWHGAFLPLILTGMIIAGNFWISLWILIRQKRILFALNLVQIGLFGMLHFQVFSTLGGHHYRYESPVQLGSWLQFTTVHVLRAADVLDCLEHYGIDWQNLKHRSIFTGLLLVALHLTVGLFLVTFVIRAMARWCRQIILGHSALSLAKKREIAEFLAEKLQRWKKYCLVPFGLAFVTCALWQQWRMGDWLLWPLDNVVRLLDIADVLEVFHWRLHSVPRGFWNGTLALGFHFLIGLFLAEWINGIHLQMLGPRAIRSIEDFIDNLSSPDEDVRTAAAQALAALGNAAQPAIPALVQALTDDSPAAGDAVRQALRQIGPGSSDLVPDLVRLLEEPAWVVRRGAVEALGNIGPAARAAVPALVGKLADQDPNLPVRAERALAAIAPYWPRLQSTLAAIPELQAKLKAGNPGLRRAAAEVLARFGPAGATAVPALLYNLGDHDEYVRLSATLALNQIEPLWRMEIFPVLMA